MGIHANQECLSSHNFFSKDNNTEFLILAGLHGPFYTPVQNGRRCIIIQFNKQKS